MVLTSVSLKPLLIGTKMVKGPKFCRGHEMEPKERRRRSVDKLGQMGFGGHGPLKADGCDWPETGQLAAQTGRSQWTY